VATRLRKNQRQVQAARVWYFASRRLLLPFAYQPVSS